MNNISEKYTTKSGLTVILNKMPYMKSVSIGIFIKCGSVYENKSNNGISHFIEHLLFKGTERRTAEQISEESDELGGTLNAYTAEEDTCIHIKALGEDAVHALDLVFDIVESPAFDSKTFETEKKVIIEEIASSNDDPEDAAQEKLMSNMFSTHPIGMPVLGSKKNVKGFLLEEVKAFYSEHYTPQNMIVSIAGCFDIDAVKEYISGTRLASEVYPGIRHRPDTVPAEIHGGIYKEKRNICQVQYVSAWPAVTINDDRFVSFVLLKDILANDDSSRLFKRLREENGLVYDVDAIVPEYLCTGLFVITTSCTADNFEAVKKIIYEEIENVCRNGVTEEELRRAKRNKLIAERICEEETASVMSSLGKRELCGLKLTNDEIIAKYETVTNEDIISAAHFAFGDKTKEAVAIVGKI